MSSATRAIGVAASLFVSPRHRFYLPPFRTGTIDSLLRSLRTDTATVDLRRDICLLRMSSSAAAKSPHASFGPGQAVNIREQKQALRKQVRVNLKALSSEEIARQSELVWERLFEMPQYQEAKSIGLFLSMPQGEIRTERALLNALRSKKRVFVPQVGKIFEQADMDLIEVIMPNHDTDERAAEEVLSSWPRNKWGIPEPPTDMPQRVATRGDIDLLVVPGLAFDRSGNRLGQGKGYYDRFIARMLEFDEGSSQPTHSMLLVASCLECQLLENGVTAPVQSYDQTMDMILEVAK